MTDLGERAAKITGFVEAHLVDRDGLVYSGIDVGTMKPFRRKDIHGQDFYPYYFCTAIDNTTWINYEDTDMATADYMDSQVLRYRATGQAEALAIARRCYGALHRLVQEGNAVARGFLPKPYGGLRHAAQSRSFSIDQFTKVMLALERFRQKEASPQERAAIAGMLLDFAHWWCSRMFTPPFRELYAVRIGQSWAPHNYAFKFYLTALAYRLSRDPFYRHWLEIFLRDKNEIFRHTSPVSANAADLAIRSLLRVGELVPREKGLWDKAIRHIWKLGKQALSQDGYGIPCHCIGRDTSRPHFLPGRTPFYGWSLERWVSRVRYGASTTLASAGLAAADIIGDRRTCMRILELRGGEGFVMYLFDEDGKQVHHRHRFLRQAICGYSTAAWLRAYWEAQQPVQP